MLLGLARTVYTHRIWPYVWWFPCYKYHMYTVYTYKCMVLANPTNCTSCPFPAILSEGASSSLSTQRSILESGSASLQGEQASTPLLIHFLCRALSVPFWKVAAPHCRGSRQVCTASTLLCYQTCVRAWSAPFCRIGWQHLKYRPEQNSRHLVSL